MPKKPGYIAEHKDAEGYHVDPKSTCCGTRIVYYSKQENLFLVLPSNHESMPRYVTWRCQRCDREIDREDRREAK